MESAPAIVIFGAAVRADGRPSPALARRIGYGLQAALAAADAPVLCSGAAGKVGPSEASVMAAALKARGVPPSASCWTRRAATPCRACWRPRAS